MKKVMLMCFSIIIFGACASFKITRDYSEQQDWADLTESEFAEGIQEPFADIEISEAEMEEVFDEWAELRKEPIHLNTADQDDLLRLPGFRPSYARALLRYRKKVGKFSTYKEINSIEGIPQDIWDQAKAFVSLGSPIDRIAQTILSPSYWTPNGQFESISRVKFPLERAEGYRMNRDGNEPVYQGPPVDRYQRFSYRSKRIQTGMTLRSGMGTVGSWFQPNWRAGYLQIKDLPLLSNAVVGDYRLSWGLGLSMNSSRSARKGSELVQLTTKKNTLGVHSGSSYLGYHSGLALSLGSKNKITVWESKRSYTASEVDSTTVRWSYSEPYFRTASEILKRDNLELEKLGFRLSHSGNVIKVGLYYWMMKADKHISTIDKIFSEKSYRIREFSMLGSDVQWSFPHGSITTEWALDRQMDLAAIFAIEMNLMPDVNLSSIYRNYSASFQSPFGSSFSAWSGQPHNEYGLYTGLELLTSSSLRTVIFVDHYRSHLPRNNDFYISKGSDMGWKTSFRLDSKYFEIYARHRISNDNIEKFDVFGRAIMAQSENHRFTARLDIKIATQAHIDWSTRVEWVQVTRSEGQEQGHQLYQDLVWKPHHSLRLQARVALFSTESYETRLYAFEPDVALSSSMPAFQGQGSRHFILLVYKPNPILESRIKWATSVLPHVYKMGSGNDEIEGNQKTNLHFSLRIKV